MRAVASDFGAHRFGHGFPNSDAQRAARVVEAIAIERDLVARIDEREQFAHAVRVEVVGLTDPCGGVARTRLDGEVIHPTARGVHAATRAWLAWIASPRAAVPAGLAAPRAPKAANPGGQESAGAVGLVRAGAW